MAGIRFSLAFLAGGHALSRKATLPWPCGKNWPTSVFWTVAKKSVDIWKEVHAMGRSILERGLHQATEHR